MGVANGHNAYMRQNDHFVMEEAWDRASEAYLSRRGSDVRNVSYGNLAPSEDEIGLLGDVRGQRILDFGCGGGHNAVACALAGAEVVGIDLSAVQLAAARALALAHGVAVEWLQGDSGRLARWQGAPFDVLLAIQVLPYVDEPAALLRSAGKLLRPGGRIIVSIDHPLRDCFVDTEMDELSPYPVRSYFDQEPLVWKFAEGMPMRAHHRPLGQWIAWMVEAGLHLQKLIELPAPPEVCDELWAADSPLSPLREIPHTAILVGTVPRA
jgi:SAM-dependent methyltransferase